MTNTTTDLDPALTRQLTLEAEALEAGRVNYHNRTRKLEGMGLAASTAYGKRATAGKVEALAELITRFIAEAKTKPGKRAAAVQLMEWPAHDPGAEKSPPLLDSNTIAFITLRTVIDMIGLGFTMHVVALNIANNIEDECRFRSFEAKNKALFEKVNSNFDKSPWAYSAVRRRSVLAHADNKFQASGWVHWEHSRRLLLGSALLDMLRVEGGLGLVRFERENSKKYKNSYYVRASEDLLEWVTGFHADRELMSPQYMPMVCPPRRWENPFEGGYFDDRLCYRLHLVKKASSSYLRELSHKDMPAVYEGINRLQETPWKINAPVMTVVQEIWESGLEVKGFPSRHELPLPPKPADFELNKSAATAWKRNAAEVYKSNVRAASKRIQTAKIMFLAGKFLTEPSLYFPMQLDFRGRMYTVPLFLNPQGCDLAKSLLTFAAGKPLGKDGVRWLAIHLANTFGEDKCSLDERAAWAFANSARIEACANDPLADRWWMEADKPFQFLAACIEWLGYLHDGGESYCCSLPIMVDGSCNGLQHFSAMLRDEVCGAQVNLVPQDKPADVYQAVADAVLLKLQADQTNPHFAVEWMAYGIDRKLCKRPVMILPYGGTQRAVRKYILDAVLERAAEKNVPHPFGDDLMKAVSYLSSVVWDTMKEVVKGPRVAMDWLKQTARLLAKDNRRIYWTTPTGFWVRQAYPNTRLRRVETKIGHKTIYYTLREELKNSVDRHKQVQAISPNFVHSLDASALVLTILKSGERGVSQFSAIHDSYGTIAADMQILMDTLRETFVQMYEAHDVLCEFAGTCREAIALDGKEVPAPPSKGNLDLRGILRSDFFFA